MALNKVEICGVNTASLPVLAQEEKEELFEKIKAGDKEARERYIKGNLRLVLSVIKRFQNSSENADDLFQIGCIGLMKAIDNFDTTLMVKFSTYAVPMIIGEIRRYLRDNSSIRVSRSLRDIANNAIYAKESDKKNKEDHWVENLSLSEAMNRLGERERHIIDMRFYEGKTQMEVAEEIGISQAQVSRLEKTALRNMRNYLRP